MLIDEKKLAYMQRSFAHYRGTPDACSCSTCQDYFVPLCETLSAALRVVRATRIYMNDISGRELVLKEALLPFSEEEKK